MEDRTLLQNLPRTPKPSLPVLIFCKLVAIALPISQIVIGALYLHKCPVQPLIPVYLVVSGAFGLTLALFSGVPNTQEPDRQGGALSTLCTSWNSIVTLFLFCWFIAGNVWIYSIYQPNYDPQISAYCDKTLYLFAFWMVTLGYILVGLLFLAGCCAMCCMCVFGGPGMTSRLSTDHV